jgi:hypothetical protein
MFRNMVRKFLKDDLLDDFLLIDLLFFYEKARCRFEVRGIFFAEVPAVVVPAVVVPAVVPSVVLLAALVVVNVVGGGGVQNVVSAGITVVVPTTSAGMTQICGARTVPEALASQDGTNPESLVKTLASVWKQCDFFRNAFFFELCTMR